MNNNEKYFANDEHISDGGFTFNILNDVSYIASRENFTREDMQFSPQKVETRLDLTDNSWCRMGTSFVPPNEHLSLLDLRTFLRKMNNTNNKAGRPQDEDIIIRTSSKYKLDNANPEPALLVGKVNSDKPIVKDLLSKEIVNYEDYMKNVTNSWKLIHTDNIPLQKKAIHGRVEIRDVNYFLELGTNMIHARDLEAGDRTIIKLPFNSTINLNNLDIFRPTHFTILGKNISQNEIYELIHKFAPIGAHIEYFIDWVNTNNNYKLQNKYKKFVAEFRYYTCNCQMSERFHIMDLFEDELIPAMKINKLAK